MPATIHTTFIPLNWEGGAGTSLTVRKGSLPEISLLEINDFAFRKTKVIGTNLMKIRQ